MKIKVSPYVAERMGRKKSDFRIDTFRSGGPGGQTQNKRDTGVRITDLKTGIFAESRSATGQDDNRKLAFFKLAEKIVEHYKKEEMANVITTHEAARAIRSYNEHRNQVTDHRTGKAYSMDQILQGRLDKLLEECREALNA